MKDTERIINGGRIWDVRMGEEGFSGLMRIGSWTGSVICSWGAGWEHVSVSPINKRITPSWADMCKVKEIFFEDDEAVIQIHPPKADYVNVLQNCLHLWRCKYKEMVLPPAILVGPRKGQTIEEIDREIDEAYEMAGEKPSGR